MSTEHARSVLFLVVVFCGAALVGGCGEAEREIAPPEVDSPAAAVHSVACKLLFESAIEGGDGPRVPGVAGAPRWGLSDAPATEVGVRRSWSTLSDAGKRQVVDAFLKLKQTTAGSGAPGAERADYETFCPDGTRNLYDFYVELHLSAFVSMGTTDMSEYQGAHMGPQFLPWHRYLLLRLEADLRQVSGDPDFMLPYWDWEDCQGDPSRCPEIFEEAFLGSPGSCDQNDRVTGYLVDRGFAPNLWSEASPQTGFSARSVNCGTKTFQRNVGCSRQIHGGRPPSADNVAAALERAAYDAAPYNSCDTEEEDSFRQYVEGYTNTDLNPICVFAGCRMHGLGHLYVGGDMAASTAPNDPIFFLHHANVDRLWAMWQERNLESPDTAVDHGNPGFPDGWRGPLFNFEQVRAEEMFDFRALGFAYETSRAP